MRYILHAQLRSVGKYVHRHEQVRAARERLLKLKVHAEVVTIPVLAHGRECLSETPLPQVIVVTRARPAGRRVVC